MNLTHRFSVPAKIDDAWTAFTRLDLIAPCFPGAAVSGVEGDTYIGFVKIKFGPVPLVYNGTAKFTELNVEAGRMVVEARGTDRRGTSNAAATVTATFTETGNITDVQVLTDLAITGRPAQFGQGVIADVSDKLLDLFLNCASEKFANGSFSAPTEPAVRPTDDSDAAGASPTGPLSEPVADDDTAAPIAEQIPSAPAYVYTPPIDTAQPDFNVFATIVPVLVKRGWPVLLGGAVGLLVLRRILRAARR